MYEDATREDLNLAVDRAVEKLLAQARLNGPPVDAMAIARQHLGIVVEVVAEENLQRSRRSAKGSVIYLWGGLSMEAQQWVIAREIGNRFKTEISTDLGRGSDLEPVSKGESLANHFARVLLAPTSWFAEEAQSSGWDLAALKDRFRTADEEMLAWRLLDLPEPCIIAVVEDGHVLRRRSNAWRVNKRLSAPEQGCVQLVQEHRCSHVVQTTGWTVQGWPVERSGRRYVILRGVIDEGYPRDPAD